MVAEPDAMMSLEDKDIAVALKTSFRSSVLAPFSRPFLSPALMRQEDKIHAMIVRTMWATLVRGGPHYREMRELFHILHTLYHEGKKLLDDLVDEDEQ